MDGPVKRRWTLRPRRPSICGLDPAAAQIGVESGSAWTSAGSEGEHRGADMVTGQPQRFVRVGFLERQLNRLMDVMANRGLGPAYTYRLEVVGRTSGRRYSTPVNLMRRSGRPYLVAPRGWTQWVRNALAAGRVRLCRGRSVVEFEVRLVPETDRAPILKDYLERYRGAVQRYFEVEAGAPVDAFKAIVADYPVLELVPAGESNAAPPPDRS
jgi:deazaflavin-dependent oxidoreductase (nitroreductase family)